MAYFVGLWDRSPYSVYNSRMNQAQTEAPLKRTFRGSRDAAWLVFRQIGPAVLRARQSYALCSCRNHLPVVRRFGRYRDPSTLGALNGDRNAADCRGHHCHCGDDAREQWYIERNRWPFGHFCRCRQPGAAKAIPGNSGSIGYFRNFRAAGCFAIHGAGCAHQLPCRGYIERHYFCHCTGR